MSAADTSPEREKAAAYLEHIQRSVYEQLGTVPMHMQVSENSAGELEADFLRDFYRRLGGFTPSQTFDEFRKEWTQRRQRALDACPAPFQEPEWYSLLIDMTREIEDALSTLSMPRPTNYLFGTLPTGQVNAMALAVPGTSYVLILFEDGLFGFANLMCKAVARSFPHKGSKGGCLEFGTSPEECDEEIRSNPEVIERFLETLAAYVVGGHPHHARAYLPESEYEPLSSNLRASMELFVLGHEFGHLTGGHLSVGKRRAALFGGTKAEQILTNWEKEAEADMRGLAILLAAMRKRGYDVSLSFWGADLFFGCIDIVGRAVQILAKGSWSDERAASLSHPPPTLRREGLRSVLQHSFGTEQSIGPLQLSDMITHILDVFWSRCEPALVAMFKDGVKLAPSWRV